MSFDAPSLLSPLARALLLSTAVTLGACSTSAPQDRLFGLVTPYRMEIVQGNVVTREQVERLRPGMTREQVAAVLGSPLLASVFHADRWDYVFTIRRQGAEPQRRSIVVWFKDDRFERAEVPELPSEREFVAAISNVRPAPVPRLQLSDEEIAKLPATTRPAATTGTEPQGPARSYPPLEPR
ncbi:outer membrane protein assembly factor BamE [Azohydromonas sediminis]|uniref:outer membrane protein assembly factor BamE n=1 Tax=Azohydromonas sediminis TaxID=2259674 RepID=UPI000E64E5EB|nr:outer membrane protein assembly factor BamE [Azohydromonas sediminis]